MSGNRRWLPVYAFITSLTVALGLLAPGDAQAAWFSLGPFGGEANIVRVSAANRDLVIAAARNGMIFRSTDSGIHWTPQRFPLQLSCVLHAFEIDPERAQTWYAGIESRYDSAAGLYRTKDGGVSWAPMPGLKGQSVWALAIWQKDPRVMAAGTAEGVYLSRDRGENWSRISPEWNRDLRPVVSLAFHPSSDQILYAGTTHLPWRTRDGGATWESIDTGMMDDSDVFSMRVDSNRPATMFASACSGVYRSDSAGSQWTRLPTPPGAFRAYQVTLDPERPETVYAGTSLGLLKSLDGGGTWRKISDDIIESMAFDPSQSGRIYFASATSGLLSSIDNGETLRETNRGFTNRNFTSFDGGDGALYASSVSERSGGLFRSDDQGLAWQKITPAGLSADESILTTAAVPGDPRTVYIATARGMQKSGDRGLTWRAIRTPPLTDRISNLVVLPGAKPILLAGTPAGLFRSDSDGVSWTRAVYLRYGGTGPLPSLIGPRIQLLQRSGDAGIGVVTSTGAFFSSDRGFTWAACPAPVDSAHWYGIALNAAHPGSVFAATSHGLFRSTNRCHTWEAMRTGLSEGDSVTLIYSSPLHPDQMFAAQNGHVFQSLDAGSRWRKFEDADGDGSYASRLLILPTEPSRVFALVPRRGILVHTLGGEAISARMPETGKSGERQPEGSH
ncbi:MAG: WD40/YVTN/BNR-like repeat-containing protein [Bryobacteraceae bacterium]